MGMTEQQQGFRRMPCVTPDLPDSLADSLALTLFQHAMQEKMREAAARGRYGWHRPETCTEQELISLLREQFVNRPVPDYVDIANYAMMLWNRARMRAQGHV